jgi:hypothetical protein
VAIAVTEQVVDISVGTAGPQGAQGAPGPEGPVGPQGPEGPYGTLAVFSASGELAERVGLHRLYSERTATLTKVRAAVGIPPQGSDVVIGYLLNEVRLGGVTIPAGEFSGVATLAQSVAVGDFFAVDIEQVGSTLPGADLTVSFTLE